MIWQWMNNLLSNDIVADIRDLTMESASSKWRGMLCACLDFPGLGCCFATVLIRRIFKVDSIKVRFGKIIQPQLIVDPMGILYNH